MKILGICLSQGKGGLELYAHKAITGLSQAGHECHFALTPNSFLGELDWRVPLVELRPAFRHLPYFTARRLADYIDAHGIDILHMHWNKDLTLAVLAKVLSRRKPRLVYSRHMEITRSKKDLYHRLLYRQVDRMLVIARFVEQQALRFLPLDKAQISLLYLGVEATQRPSPAACESMLPKSSGRFVIGMIGRIEPYKGQHILVEALALLQGYKNDITVVMAGPIMDQRYFDRLNQQIEENGLAGNINYIGVTREPARLMGCCDVVVLATYCETFGLVLAEAMRVGTAVIGTNAGGVPEIIRHNETGMLFEPGDARQLAECLSELLHDSIKHEKLGKAGKAYADSMFDEKQHFARLESVFVNM